MLFILTTFLDFLIRVSVMAASAVSSLWAINVGHLFGFAVVDAVVLVHFVLLNDDGGFTTTVEIYSPKTTPYEVVAAKWVSSNAIICACRDDVLGLTSNLLLLSYVCL